MKSSSSATSGDDAQPGPSTSRGQSKNLIPTPERAVSLDIEIESFLVHGVKYLMYGMTKKSVLTHADAVKYRPVLPFDEDDGSTTPRQILPSPGGGGGKDDDYVLLTVPKVRLIFKCFISVELLLLLESDLSLFFCVLKLG